MSRSSALVLELAPRAQAAPGPPVWLFGATAVLGIVVLAMALAETNLWLHYLIDGGEYVSLVGLLFIATAGVWLYREQRLVASLPLAPPWLLFPLITQGDQIIDHLSINSMRVITHILLAAIFATPVGVIVMAARATLPSRLSPRSRTGIIPGVRLLVEGRTREGTALLAASLLVCEMWMAFAYLGALMVSTLIVMVLAVLWWGSRPTSNVHAAARRVSERSALVLLLAGVGMSGALYLSYKNRVGVYQGSPSFLMDPHQRGTGYLLHQIAVAEGPLILPPSTDGLQPAFAAYGRTLRELLDGYYILDRNYTWHFHNELFLRNTPLLPNYRAAGLQKIARARVIKMEADRLAASARAPLSNGHPIAAVLDEVSAFLDFNFRRAAQIERMSADFEKAPAGLQHAAHLYEGEGKMVGLVLSDILAKHRTTIEAPQMKVFTAEFSAESHVIVRVYASRVVGF